MSYLDLSSTVAAPPRVADGVLSTPYTRLVKPIIDRALAGLLLLLAAPFLLVIAALVVWELGTPVMLRQPRIGLGGGIFSMYKFRTMEPDRRAEERPFAGEDRRRTHKTTHDPRHTKVGRYLRRWSLDELPQLLNVFTGDMSLVGPRPELPHIVARYEEWQHRRHAVKPGLTGLWQISEHRHRLMFECTEIDLDYLEQISLRTDARILAHTLPAAWGKSQGQ